MIASHAHRFVFVKTRKTAGTSLEIALSRHCGPDDIVTRISPADEELPRRRRGSAPAERRHRAHLVRPHGCAPRHPGDRPADLGRLLHLRRRAEPVRRGGVVVALQRPQAELLQDVRRVRPHPAAPRPAGAQRAALPDGRPRDRATRSTATRSCRPPSPTSRPASGWPSTFRTPSRGAARTTASSTARATPRSWPSGSSARSASSATSSEPAGLSESARAGSPTLVGRCKGLPVSTRPPSPRCPSLPEICAAAPRRLGSTSSIRSTGSRSDGAVIDSTAASSSRAPRTGTDKVCTPAMVSSSARACPVRRTSVQLAPQLGGRRAGSPARCR